MESIWTIRGDQTQPYSLDEYQYLIEPIESDAEELAIMAASGCGKTEAFIAYALCQADWGKRVIYCFESDKKTGLLVQERVNPNIKGSPYLSKRCAETDNIYFKSFTGKGFLYFLGLGSEGVTSSYHGDILVLDEESLMDPSKVADMKKRLAAASSVKVRKLGNPKFKGTGIHKSYMEGDQRKWSFECPKCKTEHALDWDTCVDRQKLIIACPNCKKELERKRLARWRERSKDGLGYWKITNKKGLYPSFQISRLMAPICDLRKIRDDLASDEKSAVEAATRFDLGVPYDDEESGLSQQDLWNAGETLPWTQKAFRGFMVVDPGGVFDVQIFQPRKKGEPVKCTWCGTVRTWFELEQLVYQTGISGGLIDYGPELKAAEEFCQEMERAGKNFKRVAYRLNADTGPDFEYDRKDPFLILANRTKCCDIMVSDIRAGRLKYPHKVVRDPESRFSKHLVVPKRVLVPEPRSGLLHPRWVHEQNKPDHQFHCSVYAAIQARIVAEEEDCQSSVSDWGGY